MSLSFEHAPRSPYPLTDERLLRETQEVRTVEVARDVEVGYTLLNRHRVGEAASVIAIGGFMSDLTTPDRAYEGVQLAVLDRPVLMLDLPGHGLSTRHTCRQTLDLCIRRTADSQAAPLVEAVQKLLNPNDKLDYFGISHGALMSVKSAELDPGDRVGTVFGIDLPAVRGRSTVGLQAGYMIKDNIIGYKKYQEALKGLPFAGDFEAFKTEFAVRAPDRAKAFIRKNPGLFLLNLFASINARPVGLDAWKNVLDTKASKIHVMTAEKSSVSNARAIEAFIDGLSPSQKERSQQTVIKGEDHNIGRVHLMPRAVAWARAAYNS